MNMLLKCSTSTLKPTHVTLYNLDYPEPIQACTASSKILLVEHNPVLQHIHKQLLRSLGCDVDTAKNGFEAIALFKQGYDLIFMDIGLPDIFGTYVAAEIRQYEKDHGLTTFVPIVALTASEQAASLQYTNFGINEIAVKPILIENLSKILSRYINKKL